MKGAMAMTAMIAAVPTPATAAPRCVTPYQLQALVHVALVKEFGLEKMTADQCGATSMILEPLDALPRNRFEALLGTVLAVASKKDGRLVMCGVTP